MKNKTIKIVGLVISTIGVSAIMNNLLFGVVAHKANYPVEYIGLSFFVSLGVLLSFLLLSYIFDFSSIKEDGRGFAFFDGVFSAALGIPLLYMFFSPIFVDYEVKMLPVQKIEVSGLCQKSDSYLEDIHGGAHYKNKKETEVIFSTEDHRQKTVAFAGGSLKTKKLCSWIELNKDLLIEEVTVTTPIGSELHLGRVFAKQEK